MTIKQPLKIIIFGIQASGKGTQAEKISRKFKIKHISIGEIFRKELKNNTVFGKKINKYIKSGDLVPDSITNEIVENALNSKKFKKGFILDGYPRSIKQAEFLEKILKDSKVLIIKLDVSEKTVIKRISGRLMCPQCHRNYHTLYNKPRNDELCNKCKIKLIRREDDTPKAIKERIKIYYKETDPLTRFYLKKQNRKLMEINGERSINSVFKDIAEKINKEIQ